jgi:cell division transport system ATP-binding protein
VIRFDNVSKTYAGGFDALSDITLHVAPGEFVFLTGHSGAGKSSLLRLVALVERVTRGRLVVDGRDLERLGRRSVPEHRRQIGFIFQDHRLLMDRTVFDNVALPLVIAGHPAGETARRVRAALDKVGLLHKERAAPRTLSSGEQQRVGIARAVVNRPKVLLADEPTGNLDPALSRDILQLFAQFNAIGVTVLIATHDLALLEQVPHRRVTLHAGRLEAGA